MKPTYTRLEQLSTEYLSLKNYYRKTLSCDFYMNFHMHSQIEIMYCEKGSFRFLYKKTENGEPQSVTIHENCFILVNTGFYHKIDSDTPETKLINIEWDPVGKAKLPSPVFAVCIKELFSINLRLQKIRESALDFTILSDSQNVKSTLVGIIENADAQNRTADSDILLNLMLAKLFIDISHCDSISADRGVGVLYVKKAITYFNRHYMNKISMEDVANDVGISAAYLQQLFKKSYNDSVHHILIKIRLEHAKYLIVNSGLSSAKIAHACGFHTRENLIYNFKKFEHCTPSQYKYDANNKYIGRFLSTDMIELNL